MLYIWYDEDHCNIWKENTADECPWYACACVVGNCELAKVSEVVEAMA